MKTRAAEDLTCEGATGTRGERGAGLLKRGFWVRALTAISEVGGALWLNGVLRSYVVIERPILLDRALEGAYGSSRAELLEAATSEVRQEDSLGRGKGAGVRHVAHSYAGSLEDGDPHFDSKRDRRVQSSRSTLHILRPVFSCRTWR